MQGFFWCCLSTVVMWLCLAGSDPDWTMGVNLPIAILCWIAWGRAACAKREADMAYWEVDAIRAECGREIARLEQIKKECLADLGKHPPSWRKA